MREGKDEHRLQNSELGRGVLGAGFELAGPTTKWAKPTLEKPRQAIPAGLVLDFFGVALWDSLEV